MLYFIWICTRTDTDFSKPAIPGNIIITSFMSKFMIWFKFSSFISDTYTVYGCIFDVMELECAPTEYIFVLEAVHAAYDVTCPAETCCEPDQVNDCTESISSNDPDTWRLIRADCNYKSSCLFQYQGNELLPCGVALADYMMISYTCTTGKFSYSCTTGKICCSCTAVTSLNALPQVRYPAAH